MKPKFLIIGNMGQVGWELEHQLAPLGTVTAVDLPHIDLTNPDLIRSFLRSVGPNVILNAAAYTAVDKAEVEPEIAMAVNGIAPGIMAEEAKRLGAILVHYSTDYVFDGAKRIPYTEQDVANPLNVYGRSKLAGDAAIGQVGGAYLIFRTSWVYGSRAKNFFLTVLRLAKERSELKVVDDQIGAPTWCTHLAEVPTKILTMLLSQSTSIEAFRDAAENGSGIYNTTCGGVTSWARFAQAIIDGARARFAQALTLRNITPISTAEYPMAARRPAYSVLSCDKLRQTFDISLPPWDATLQSVLDEVESDSSLQAPR